MSNVVVAGAGLAGLAAARWLVAHGHEITVVEARARVGGRTEGLVLDDGTPLELGGQWLGEGHTRMHELVSEPARREDRSGAALAHPRRRDTRRADVGELDPPQPTHQGGTCLLPCRLRGSTGRGGE